MHKLLRQFALFVVLTAFCLPVLAVDHYVSLTGGHVPPFTNWVAAATNIQDAIDAASAGETVWVTNGVYATGGKVMAGDLTNRVALDKALTVRSVNGPTVTTIQGLGPNGPAALRCAWLTHGAGLAGFTLSGGATRDAGDVPTLRSGGGIWCEGADSVVSNCISIGNTASTLGGGGYQGNWVDCILQQNSAISGGGAAYGKFLNCYIRQNFASGQGGGIYSALVSGASLVNCLVTGNSSATAGGGVFANSSLAVLLTNCTVSLNSAVNGSGGAFSGTLINCILYQNISPNSPNYGGSVMTYCCSTPLPEGFGNIDGAPQFLGGTFHLSNDSPCRNAGTNLDAGTDIVGQVWSNQPSMGCFEWQLAPILGNSTPIATSGPGRLLLDVLVAGESVTCFWTKEGVQIENDAHYDSTHGANLVVNGFGPSDAGSYQVVVSNAYGMVTSGVASVVVRCVNAAATTPAAPYLDWESAATNIQDAIEVAADGEFVLVTNGIYASGGKVMAGDLTNRVALDKALTVQSVNGPFATFIQGDGATNGLRGVRGVWMTNGAMLDGFTVRWGATRTSGDSVTLLYGGGIWCASSNALIARCVIQSNAAPILGGGVYRGNLRNCIVSRNSAQQGGGAAYSILNNCTVVSNAGSGLFYCATTNSISYFNTGGNFASSSPAYFCCTTPSAGPSNITANPLLLDDGIHLSIASPCRGRGTNTASGTDLDGQPWGTPPSIGCDEWQDGPTIISQPDVQTSADPLGLRIGVGIVGQDPFFCYWSRDGVPVTNGPGYQFAATTNLVVLGYDLLQAGNYRVVVSNGFGMATSEVVQMVMHTVDANGSNPLPPYSTWATAATNIQDAIDVAGPGAVVLVTNGVYATGGKVMAGDLTNRVALDKPLFLRSVNGFGTTSIDGASATNGPAAVRCAWLTNGAILSGFTLTRGATRGVASPTSQEMNGGGVWGASTNALVTDCMLATNCAGNQGGGAYQVTLERCSLVGNRAVGSGIVGIGWPNAGSGGGAALSLLRNCTVKNNTAEQFYGGGVYNCTVFNSAIINNVGATYGGGADGGWLINSTLTRNRLNDLNTSYGGGASRSSLTNCLVFDNYATAYQYINHYNATVAYSCATPLPAGPGNISSDPLLLSDGIHLSAASPCIGAGTNLVVSGTDIDGQSWSNPPSMGCDEWQPEPLIIVPTSFSVSSLRGTLTPSVVLAGATPLTYRWSKDGVEVVEGPKYSNVNSPSLVASNFNLADAGGYQVVVSNAFGVVTSKLAQLVIHCVDAGNGAPSAPYTNWASAAVTIQDAIDAASAGVVVLVTNGIYASGGKAMVGDLTNRVAIDKPLTVVSVNGPEATSIRGAWDPVSTNGSLAVRGVWVFGGAALGGFTVEFGATRDSGESANQGGGGVWCELGETLVENCIITCNAAYYFGGGIAGGKVINCKVLTNRAGPYSNAFGGGANNSTLENCYVFGNSSSRYGGGISGGSLANCTVVGNYAALQGGGTCFTDATNSVVCFNSVQSGTLSPFANYYSTTPQVGWFTHCCTTPFKGGLGNVGNFTSDPQLMDSYHLASTSPCRGAGTNLSSGTDLDGEPWAATPSVGCDEVWESAITGPLSVTASLSLPVIAERGLATLTGTVSGRASRLGWDFGDGSVLTNQSLFVTSHVWTNAGNYNVSFTAWNADYPGGISTNLTLQVVPLVSSQIESPTVASNGFTLSFQGQPGVLYYVEKATNLVPPVVWTTVQSVFSTGQVMQVTDKAATNDMRFYRVKGP